MLPVVTGHICETPQRLGPFLDRRGSPAAADPRRSADCRFESATDPVGYAAICCSVKGLTTAPASALDDRTQAPSTYCLASSAMTSFETAHDD